VLRLLSQKISQPPSKFGGQSSMPKARG
jgi:hypothetical protein